MSYYTDVYMKRVNRYGENPQERLENGRQENFEKFLNQSPHYVKFTYRENKEDERQVEAVFEPYRSDETRTMMHVLTRVGEEFEAGEIVTIGRHRYMFYFWDERENSGYNRWCVLRLNQSICWLNEDGQEYESEGYIYSQEDNMLKNELKSRSRSATLYLENLKLDFMVMPSTPSIKVGSYLTLEVTDIKRSYRVTGFDFLSTPGVLYVSMDPTLERDLTPVREKTPEDNPSDFFWLGGKVNG